MFDRGQSARRKLVWSFGGEEDAVAAPNNQVAGEKPLPPLSFSKAPTDVDAHNCLKALEARGDSPERALLETSMQLASVVSHNNAQNNFHDLTNKLIEQFNSYKAKHDGSHTEASTFCIVYLINKMSFCAMKDPHFNAFYLTSNLKKYLEANRPHVQSPQKNTPSPFGSPTKG